MSFNNFNNFNNFGGFDNEQSFCRHLRRFIGQTVIIFTTSGGVSGCGFTGVLLSVGCNTVRIDSRQGFAPACPLSSPCCCGDFDDNDFRNRDRDCDRDRDRCRERDCDRDRDRNRSVGSVCDIPICSIVAFCHNAI